MSVDDFVKLLTLAIALLGEEVARLQRRQNASETRIEQLERKNILLQSDVEVLRQYAVELRMIMSKNGISPIPEMPALHRDTHTVFNADEWSEAGGEHDG